MVTSLEYAKISLNQYIVFNYRPQGSCEGYVFTPVILFTGGGGLPQCILGYHPPPGRSHHPPPQEGSTPPPPGRKPREAAAADGTYPTGTHSCLEFS